MNDTQILDKLNGYIVTMDGYIAAIDEIIKNCPADSAGAKSEYIKTRASVVEAMARLLEVRVMLSRPGAAPVAAPAPVAAAPAPQGGQKQYVPPITMAAAQAIIQKGCPKCGKPVNMKMRKKDGKPYISCSGNTYQDATCDFYNSING